MKKDMIWSNACSRSVWLSEGHVAGESQEGSKISIKVKSKYWLNWVVHLSASIFFPSFLFTDLWGAWLTLLGTGRRNRHSSCAGYGVTGASGAHCTIHGGNIASTGHLYWSAGSERCYSVSKRRIGEVAAESWILRENSRGRDTLDPISEHHTITAATQSTGSKDCRNGSKSSKHSRPNSTSGKSLSNLSLWTFLWNLRCSNLANYPSFQHGSYAGCEHNEHYEHLGYGSDRLRHGNRDVRSVQRRR